MYLIACHALFLSRCGLRGDGGIHYFSRITSPESTEEIRIRMSPDGRVLSATRARSRTATGQIVDQGRLWVEDGKAFLLSDGMQAAFSYSLPEGKAFAVDGSLLLLIRTYPCDTSETPPHLHGGFRGSVHHGGAAEGRRGKYPRPGRGIRLMAYGGRCEHPRDTTQNHLLGHENETPFSSQDPRPARAVHVIL